MERSRKLQQKELIKEVVAVKASFVPLLIIVSILFVAFAAAYNYLTPLTTPTVLHARDGGAANPDEPAHILYTSAVASGHLPVFSASSQDYEAAQPPAYYALAAVAYKLSPNDDVVRAHNVRWVATFLGLAVIWLTFAVVRKLPPFDDDTAAFSAIIVALIPMNISLSASVGNDTATNLVIALFLLQLTVLFQTPTRINQNFFITGFIIALGLWTKSSTLLLIPVLVVAVIAAVAQKLLPLAQAACGLAIALATAAVVSSPWLIRNQLLYGDVFAQTVVFHQLAARNVSPNAIITALGLNWYLSKFVTWTFESFWGVFDSMNLYLPPKIYGVLAVFAIISLIAGKVTLLRQKLRPIERTIYLSWATLAVFTVIGYLQYNSHFFQLQGRYLYPALIPLSAVGALGFKTFVPARYLKLVQYGSLIGLVLLNILCLLMISGRYSS